MVLCDDPERIAARYASIGWFLLIALCRLLGLSALRRLSALGGRLSTRRGWGALGLLAAKDAADAATNTSNRLANALTKALSQATHGLP